MTDVTVDLKLLETKVDHFFLPNPDSSRAAYTYLQEKVFKKHKIDSATYFENYEYYLSHKKQMLKILEDASKRLEVSQEEMSPKPAIE